MIENNHAYKTEASPKIEQALKAVFWILVLLFLVVLGFNSLFHQYDFSDPDTMNFVDIARNISSGHGIVQSTLGFNQSSFSADDPIPVPFTSQPPLYPLLTAGVSLGGIPVDLAALLVSLISFGLTLCFVCLLCLELYDIRVALFSVAVLMVYEPVHFIAAAAYSDLTGLLLLLMSLWLLAKLRRVDRTMDRWLLFSGGLTAGLAFATRYALLPLIAVGCVFILRESKHRFSGLAWYLPGFMIPAGWVIGRNLFLTGALLPTLKPSTVSLVTNVFDLIKAVGGSYLPDGLLTAKLQILTLSILLAVLVVAILIRKEKPTISRQLLFDNGRYILPLWSLLYFSFLVHQRTRNHFDDIDTRLVLMGSVPLVIVFIAVLLFVLPLSTKPILLCSCLLTFLAGGREVYFNLSTPQVDKSVVIQDSDYLSWIKNQTTSDDLLIGDDIVYVPFYFNYPKAISFSPYPYSDYFDYKLLQTIAQHHCLDRGHIYLLIRSKWWNDEDGWTKLFGEFITNLVYGRVSNYPDIKLVIKLKDATVYAYLPKRGHDLPVPP